MNSKLVILSVLLASVAVVHSFKYNSFGRYGGYPSRHYGGLYGGLRPYGGCGCDDPCDDPCDPCAPPCAPVCAPPCAPLCAPACPTFGHCSGAPCSTIHVSPVVGLLTKMKAKLIEKLKGDDCCDGYSKKCKWMHSPFLCKKFDYCNSYC